MILAFLAAFPSPQLSCLRFFFSRLSFSRFSFLCLRFLLLRRSSESELLLWYNDLGPVVRGEILSQLTLGLAVLAVIEENFPVESAAGPVVSIRGVTNHLKMRSIYYNHESYCKV